MTSSSFLTKAACSFHFLGTAVFKSGLQFGAVFGLLIVGGAILTLLSKWTSNVFRQFVYPQFGLYFFGWIGVPVHEFCHAVFCKLFGHDVKEVKWFDPEGKDGAHGFVVHEYQQWNPYQRIGQFFIGLGPVLLGPILLAALFYVCIPAGRMLFDPITVSPASVSRSGVLLAKAIINKATLTNWAFYLFLYLAISISSQMELSLSDIKQATIGAVPLFLFLIAANVIALFFRADWHQHAMKFGLWILTMGFGVFTLATLLAVANLILCLFLMTLINRCFGGEGINPFRT